MAMATGAAAVGGPTGQLPGMQGRSPFRDAAPGPPKLDAKIRYVKLDSCAIPNITRPRPGGLSDEEAGASDDLERYHAMLVAYREGNVAGSVRPMLEMGVQRLTRALSFVNRRGIDPHAPWEPRLYGLAAMLHTDAALLAADGSVEGDPYTQFQIAADLLALGATCAPDSIRPLVPRWYVTLSRYLRDRNAFAVSAVLLDLARARLKDDASVFTESGLLAESLATIHALSMPTDASWRSGDARTIVGLATSRRRAWLANAVTWFGQAAELDPDNGENLLHLGRVRALRLEDDRALRSLNASLDKASSTERAYLAAIFIAAVHDRQGRLDEAASFYRTALERFPGSHSARIGLADVLRRSGRLDESRALVRALASDAGGATDPLWWYLLEPPGAAEARLAALRTEVCR